MVFVSQVTGVIRILNDATVGVHFRVKSRLNPLGPDSWNIIIARGDHFVEQHCFYLKGSGNDADSQEVLCLQTPCF